jgi:endonuclease YncB( thermonuclease family)
MRGIALALTFLPYPSFAIAGVIEGIVVNVIDSDTITVLDVNKQQHRIRIAGIDATDWQRVQEAAWRVSGAEGCPRRVR